MDPTRQIMRRMLLEARTSDWGWITPAREFLWPEGNESHGQIVARYWEEHVPEVAAAKEARAAGDLDAPYISPYPWAFDQGWIRFTADSIQTPTKGTTRRQWDRLMSEIVINAASPIIYLDYMHRHGPNDYESVRYGAASKKDLFVTNSARDAMKLTSQY
jgi:hypothetical protein